MERWQFNRLSSSGVSTGSEPGTGGSMETGSEYRHCSRVEQDGHHTFHRDQCRGRYPPQMDLDTHC